MFSSIMPLPRQPKQARGKNEWCFSLGREPLLSAAEITAVFERKKITAGECDVIARPTQGRPKQSPYQQYLIIQTNANINPPALIKRLGGTIKISEGVGDIPLLLRGGRGGIAAPAIADFLNQYIPAHKINFSISGEVEEKFGLAVKKELKNLGRSARYYEPKNTATIIFNNLIDKGADLTVVGDEIFITRAVQPIEELGARDYGRPGRDNRGGMLPPKLAMMMINLAQAPREAIILDPFCGSGTILTEAMLMGYKNLIGSDVSKQAIENCDKNIKWVHALSFPPACRPPAGRAGTGRRKRESSDSSVDSRFRGNDNVQIFQADIKNLTQKIPACSIDAIISEPYLGKPLRGGETKEELRAQTEELKKLYIAAFEQFAKILKPDGIVVFILPQFKCKNEWLKIDCLEEIKKRGFAPHALWPEHEYLLYHRPDQRIGREIWRFIFRPHGNTPHLRPLQCNPSPPAAIYRSL